MSLRQWTEGISADLHIFFSYYGNTQIIWVINQSSKRGPRENKDGVLGLTEENKTKEKSGSIWRGVCSLVKSPSKNRRFKNSVCNISSLTGQDGYANFKRREGGICLAVTRNTGEWLLEIQAPGHDNKTIHERRQMGP
jgi:hypothetical protein